MKIYPALLLSTLLIACSDSDSPKPDPVEEPGKITLPDNPAFTLNFIDEDGRPGHVSGALAATLPADSNAVESAPDYYVVDLLDQEGNLITTDWYRSQGTDLDQLTVSGEVPEGRGFSMNVFAANEAGRSEQGVSIKFHDFTGNVLMAGPGGDIDRPWVYGQERAKIPVYRDAETGECKLDNGFVYVVDMREEIDNEWPGDAPNVADDIAFPALQFECEASPYNTERPTLFDENDAATPDNIWSYSVHNDAMFYGDVTYRALHSALGEPPLAEKLRIRVHYADGFSPNIFWDGAYANFTEGYPGVHHSPVSLDILAHEIGHGVLNNMVPAWAGFDDSTPLEVRTAQEAFSDMTGFVAKYKHSGEMQWVHGEEAKLRERDLSQIITEDGAVASYLDYADAGNNYYLGVGLLTYPFNQLVQSRGVESAYRLFTEAAVSCWADASTLTEIALCVKSTAAANGDNTADIEAAFKAVKIQVFEEGALSHFEAETFKKRVVFSDNSRSTGQVTAWHWDFGDGSYSTEASPEHTYNDVGEYTVTLTVTDNTQDTDTFSRQLELSDQYCEPGTSFFNKAQIDTVSVGGQALEFMPGQHDYGMNPIAVDDLSSVAVDITGFNNGEAGDFDWMVWLDVNDNGIYEPEEVVASETLGNEVYEWETALDVSAIPEGEARYLRITGRPYNGDPCLQYFGQVLDVQVRANP